MFGVARTHAVDDAGACKSRVSRGTADRLVHVTQRQQPPSQNTSHMQWHRIWVRHQDKHHQRDQHQKPGDDSARCVEQAVGHDDEQCQECSTEPQRATFEEVFGAVQTSYCVRGGNVEETGEEDGQRGQAGEVHVAKVVLNQ